MRFVRRINANLVECVRDNGESYQIRGDADYVAQRVAELGEPEPSLVKNEEGLSLPSMNFSKTVEYGSPKPGLSADDHDHRPSPSFAGAATPMGNEEFLVMPTINFDAQDTGPGQRRQPQDRTEPYGGQNNMTRAVTGDDDPLPLPTMES